MNKKIIIDLVVVFSIGLIIGYEVHPYFPPKKTIYDKLQDMQISWQRDDWGFGLYLEKLQNATSIEEFWNLEFFKMACYEKRAQHVYVDSIYNVVWMEIWKENIPTDIEYIGFCFYSEPDGF